MIMETPQEKLERVLRGGPPPEPGIVRTTETIGMPVSDQITREWQATLAEGAGSLYEDVELQKSSMRRVSDQKRS